MLARIKVLVAKVPTICAALDCQGGDSGQITAGGWGEGEGEIFKRVLLAFQEQKTCLQVSGFICLQVFCSKKGGQNNKGNGPRRESEKGSELGVMTRQLRCLFVLLARLFVIDAASPGG